MDLVSLIDQWVDEQGSAAERLLLIKKQAEKLQRKVLKLEKQLSVCNKALTKLQNNKDQYEQRIKDGKLKQFVLHRGGLFKMKPSGRFHKAVYCPECLVRMSSVEGSIEYTCMRCGIFVNFSSQELPHILTSLEEAHNF